MLKDKHAYAWNIFPAQLKFWNHFADSVKQELKPEWHDSGKEIKMTAHSKDLSMPEKYSNKLSQNWKLPNFSVSCA